MLTAREKKLRYGKPWTTILYFCVPTVLIMVIQAAYNIIDKILALKFAAGDLSVDPFYVAFYNHINTSSVTEIPLGDMKSFINLATQYSTQTYNLLFAFAVMAGMGCAMTFSIAFGQRNEKKMREITGNGFSFTLLFSVLISFCIFCLIFPGFNSVFIRSQMGGLYNPINNYLAWEYSYPMLAAAPLLFLSYYFICLLRSEGRMAWIIVIMLSSVLINSGAAIFFMKVCHLKMTGAMLGTVCAWAVQVIWGFIIVFRFKTSYTKFTWANLVLKWENICLFLKAGLPNFIAGASFVIVSFVSTSLVVRLPQQIHVNETSLYQQLMSSISPWMGVIFSAATGISQGSRAIIAYNFGAKKYHRIWQIIKPSSIFFFLWFVFMLVILASLGDKMMVLFAFPKDLVQQYRWWLLLVFASYPFASFTLIGFTLYQGINRPILASFVNSLRAFIVALPVIGLGYLTATATDNPIYYFVFFGMIDLLSAMIIIPILIISWKKYRNNLVDVPDDFKIVHEDDKIITKQKVETKKQKSSIKLKIKKHS